MDKGDTAMQRMMADRAQTNREYQERVDETPRPDGEDAVADLLSGEPGAAPAG